VAKKVALTIYFDELTGEVDEIKSTKRFSDEGALFRIDVLKDSITALKNIYQYERSQFFLEFNEIGES
tara:strand:- start:1005 stop:1208 length:204 start_codon:yes stop_codon:yes gene_type:complete